MITVDYKDRRPIYEQLTANITELALSGELQPDEQLPSVRQLASQLGINPNTISKAYSELERQMRECVRDLKRSGVNKARLLEIIEEEFKE